MTEALEVRYVDLPEMTVASALGFGKEPEGQAWEMINAYASDQGLQIGPDGIQTYGFNNPNPSAGSENYGYEIWLPVTQGTTANEPIKIKQVPSQSYAVTRFTGISRIGAVWKQLVAHVEDSQDARLVPCETAGSWLEALLNPSEQDPEKWVFDIYLAVEK